MRNNRFLLSTAALALVLAAGGASTADASSVTLRIGDYVETHNDADADIYYWTQGERIYFGIYPHADLEPFGVTWKPPVGTTLKRGQYQNLEGYTNGRAMPINGWYGTAGCQDGALPGTMDVRQVSWGSSGQLLSLDATVMHTCSWGIGEILYPSYVEIHYRTLPWQFQYVSNAGDPLGGGRRRQFDGDTTDMGLVGTPATGFSYAVSGEREEWLVEFAPPAGQSLTVGTTYTTSQAGGPGLARLVVGNRDHDCAASTGSLKVVGMTTNATTGKLSRLSATFTVRCDGHPPLKGTIRYNL